MSTANKVLEALQAYDLKRQRDGMYRSNSPLRPGSNSHGFTVTIEDGEHGAFFDHVSQQAGSLYDLAALLGVPVPTAHPVVDTKRRYDGLEDYARAHGVDPAQLEAWHWRETQHQSRPALLIPTRTGDKVRFLDGKKPAYKPTTTGYVACWYGFSSKISDCLNEGWQLVICNGEISTIAGQSKGLAAIAMTGGEKSEIPTALLSELKGKVADVRGLQIIVAMDCDDAGRRSGRGIAQQLKEQGFTARAVDLGLSKGGDLADFCMLFDDARERLDTLADIPEPPEQKEMSDRFLDIDAMLALPPQKWLMKGFIPERGLCMVFGASGVGKSFYALDLAMQIAVQKSVIYVAAEGETGMTSRVKAYMNHHAVKPPGIRFFLGSVDLFEPESNYTWQELAARYKPSLIVIDTLAMCSGAADENSTRDMKKIVDAAKRIASELDAAVLVVHHTNKGGREVRGNMSLFNACDTVIRVSKSDDLIVVESKKTKDLEPFKTYYLKPLPVMTGYIDDDGEAIASLVLLPADKVIPTDDLTELQQGVLETLATSPNLSLRELADIHECSYSSVNRSIKRLETLNLIQPFDGKSRNLTEKGWKVSQGSESVSGVSGVSGDSGGFQSDPPPKVGETPETVKHPREPMHIPQQPALLDVEPKSKNWHDYE